MFHKRAQRSPRGVSTYFVIIPLYILAMIHLSVRWTVIRGAFVVHGDTSDSILLGFLGQPQWCIALSVISFNLMTLIADYVTVSYSVFEGDKHLIMNRSGGVGWFGAAIGKPRLYRLC